MKKLMIGLTATALISSASLAFATEKTEKTTTQKNSASVTVSAQQQNTTINLYENPDKTAKVLDTVSVSQRLVPFFRKDEWLKVGDPNNGNVGWINKNDFQKALNAAYHQHVKTMFVEVNQTGDKPEIVAYENGKKLSDSEAQALYQKMQMQQRSFEKQFQRDINSMNNTFFAMPPMPMMQPIIVIEQPKVTEPKKSETKKS